jgi:hypothetical protein
MTFLVHVANLEGFYCQLTKLGSTQLWIPTIINVIILDVQSFFSRLQWCPMPNELWTNPWISIHYPNFLPIQYHVPNFLSSWNCKVECDSNYGICGEWIFFINLDIHGDKILKLTLLTFGLGGLYVCKTFYFYTFPYDNTIIIWIDEKTKWCLFLAWCFLVVVHY